MRDPQASVTFEADRVLRHLNEALPADHFLRSELARAWMDRGDLVPFEMLSPTVVAARRLQFVTHPFEWCDSQLHAAARLTLRLQQEAVAAGFDLKDASAWNVIFDGARPVFCDLMSLQPLRDRKWWAAGQFARHFILPLLLSRRRGLQAHQAFSMWRDGVPEHVAREMLGPRRFLGRYWPLMVSSPTRDAHDAVSQSPVRDYDGEAIKSFRSSLLGGLSWMLEGVSPRRDRVGKATYWQDYAEARAHYEASTLALKRQQVGQWLMRLKPAWALDLGCNAGEFSRIATGAGAQVIAVDADHGAIERVWASGDPGLHPVVAHLDDLSGGRGWEGREHPGLSDRLVQSVDVTLMLALVHHLAVGASIPLSEIATFAARCTRRWLIVELISSDDVQLRSLCEQRLRDPLEFGIDRQKAAFAAARFEVVDQVELGQGERVLVLMERVP